MFIACYSGMSFSPEEYYQLSMLFNGQVDLWMAIIKAWGKQHWSKGF